MNKITKKEVGDIAQLARLNLSDKDLEKYQEELAAVLGYVETINEVDTKNIIPTAQVSGLTDIVRPDKRKDSSVSREELLANAPEHQDGYIKVKAVLE